MDFRKYRLLERSTLKCVGASVDMYEEARNRSQ